MLATINGYYDGAQVIINENERKYLRGGDKLTITVLNRPSPKDSLSSKRKKIIGSGEYVTPTGITSEVVESYLRTSRDDR